VPLVALAIVAGGYAWIAVLSSLNSTAQMVLPDWVRSRGLSLYLLVFFGGQSIGALVWGIVVQKSDTRVALVCVAGGLIATLLVARRYPLRATHALDLRAADAYPEPVLAMDPHPTHGPVLVTIEYRVPAERAEAFRDAMQRVGRTRRRSGGTRWGLFQDAADPERFVEAYLVATWEEHMRQHTERVTRADRASEERARELLADGTEPRVEHLLFAYD
jgi:MFS family permease